MRGGAVEYLCSVVARFFFLNLLTATVRSTLFPYTTLFRSVVVVGVVCRPADLEPAPQVVVQHGAGDLHVNLWEIGRAHVGTPVTDVPRMPSSARKKNIETD